MKNYFFIIFFYSIILSSCLQKQKFELQEGDLLFQDLDSLNHHHSNGNNNENNYATIRKTENDNTFIKNRDRER